MGGGGGYDVKNYLNIPNVILIIGESTQRNLMGLYGYPLQNNPHLTELQKSGNLFTFTDVVSPNVYTDYCVPKITTFSNNDNNDIPWYKQMNIVDTMRLAGYNTYWFSNQEALSIWGAGPQLISRRAEHLYNSALADTSGATSYDSILLKSFDNAKVSGKERFIVFHLMGAHVGYVNRYPKTYNIFNVKTLREKHLDFLGSKKLDDNQATFRAQYINAILFNDYVVNEIIKRFSNEDSIVFYLSDHGDEVYQVSDFVGHSASNPTKNMVEIPFMIYVSDTFKQKHKDIVERIEKSQNLPFMSDDFIHAFLDLLGIQSPELDYTRSLFSKDYNKSRKRIILGLDYDKDIKNSTTSLKPKL